MEYKGRVDNGKARKEKDASSTCSTCILSRLGHFFWHLRL